MCSISFVSPLQCCIFDFVHLHEQSSSFFLLCNDWICTATRIYKPDGFNPFCHDYVHIVYVYIPPLLYLPHVCIFMYMPSWQIKFRKKKKMHENQAENWFWNLVPKPISILCSPADHHHHNNQSSDHDLRKNSNSWIFIDHAGLIFVTHMCECINYNISKYHNKIPVDKSAR